MQSLRMYQTGLMHKKSVMKAQKNNNNNNNNYSYVQEEMYTEVKMILSFARYSST